MRVKKFCGIGPRKLAVKCGMSFLLTVNPLCLYSRKNLLRQDIRTEKI